MRLGVSLPDLAYAVKVGTVARLMDGTIGIEVSQARRGALLHTRYYSWEIEREFLYGLLIVCSGQSGTLR